MNCWIRSAATFRWTKIDMKNFPNAFRDLVESLAQFPGIGKRSAERIAFYILKMKPDEITHFVRRMEEVHNHIKPCVQCNNFSSEEICAICANPRREKDVVCVVEEPKDIIAIEKTSQYNGLYYVLLGAVSPLEGINGEDLPLQKLLRRCERKEIREVIISTDPDTDGELTAQYLVERLSQYNVKIYRIAIGIPLGTKIEYIDSVTLGKALQEKRSLL
ncbi:MAG: recombination protein RecR [Candidatus Omnitrophica bacterium]|nr:recombination protein RecR [Candidatus Omnitrophota bacterium]